MQNPNKLSCTKCDNKFETKSPSRYIGTTGDSKLLEKYFGKKIGISPFYLCGTCIEELRVIKRKFLCDNSNHAIACDFCDEFVETSDMDAGPISAKVSRYLKKTHPERNFPSGRKSTLCGTCLQELEENAEEWENGRSENRFENDFDDD